MSRELKALKEHFEMHTGIRVLGTIETHSFPHWKRLVFSKLNCDQLEEISRYLRATFSVKGKYTHNLPSIGIFQGNLVLTIDKDLIREHINIFSY
jgi:hypothetical protein